MRTSILLIVLLLETPLWAQDDEKKERAHGIRAGWHYSDLGGKENFDPRSGWYAGVYHNWLKAPLISASIGVEGNSAGAVSGDTEVRLAYVGVPLNGRLKVGPVYFDLGLDAAFKVSEKWLVDGESVDLGDEVEGESFDFLGHAGAGLRFFKLGLEARYRYAFTEVYEGYRNQGLQVGLVLFFGK